MAIFLKCRFCGNAYTDPPRRVGDICGVNNCSGPLVHHKGMPSSLTKMLKCEICGNVYFSPPRKSFDKCGVNGCTGKLRVA